MSEHCESCPCWRRKGQSMGAPACECFCHASAEGWAWHIQTIKRVQFENTSLRSALKECEEALYAMITHHMYECGKSTDDCQRCIEARTALARAREVLKNGGET